jgi:hypothetical protein
MSECVSSLEVVEAHLLIVRCVCRCLYHWFLFGLSFHAMEQQIQQKPTVNVTQNHLRACIICIIAGCVKLYPNVLYPLVPAS